MRKRGIRLGCCILLLLLMEAATAFAAMVTATGQGSTERNALHDAMRQAIEQEVGLLIDSRTYVQNYQVINDRIYTQSSGYIESYDILDRSFFNGIWKVDIRAQVRSEALRTDLMSKLQKKALIGANMQDPRIGVLAADGNGTEYTSLENAIISGLQNQGFSRMIDLNQIDASVRRRLASAEAEGDMELRNMLLNHFHVDYMVTAQVSTQSDGEIWGAVIDRIPEADPLGGILHHIDEFKGKVTANASVRMLNVNTGEIVYAGSFSAKSSKSGAGAADNAMLKLSNDIVKAISNAAIQKAANPEQHVTLIITDSALGSMSETYQRISAIPGVNHVFTRSASYGTIQVDVDYDGTAYDLASELERNGIMIKEMNSEYIKI